MANKKITDLTELTVAASDDYLEIVDTSANTSKKISLENLAGGLATISNTAPTPTASSGTFTTVSAACKTMTVGKLRIYIGYCYINSKGTASGTLRIPIPTGTPQSLSGGIYAGTANINGIVSATCRLNPSNSYIEIDKYDGTSIIGDYIGVAFTIVYEIK